MVFCKFKKLLICCFFALSFIAPSVTQANSTVRPSYAQYAPEASANSLGIVSGIWGWDLSALHYIPSNLVNQKTFTVVASYGYQGDNADANMLAIDFAIPLLNDQLVLAFGEQVSFLGKDDSLNTGYYAGGFSANVPLDAVFNFGAAYNFGSYGSIGANLKVPFDNYNKDAFEGGMLLGVSYTYQIYGFNFIVGLDNIGFMANDDGAKGVYPDIELGIGYTYSKAGERVVSVGISIENNIGAYINSSSEVGLGMSIRLFSTGVLKEDTMLDDPGIATRDAVGKNKLEKQPFYSNLYLNLGFTFEDQSFFSLGLSSQIDSYTIDLALVFPSHLGEGFSFYVTMAKKVF